jgi:hypothetical protein
MTGSRRNIEKKAPIKRGLRLFHSVARPFLSNFSQTIDKTLDSRYNGGQCHPLILLSFKNPWREVHGAPK